MATEIERKFLVSSDDWRIQVRKSVDMQQGYLSSNGRSSIRIRVSDQAAFINIKSATLGVRRSEFEYPVPLPDAREMLTLCEGALIDKTRHYIDFEGHTWEVDVFRGDNAGLVVAEIELGDETEPFVRPDWLGDEVSDDTRYYNVCLVSHPYKNW